MKESVYCACKAPSRTSGALLTALIEWACSKYQVKMESKLADQQEHLQGPKSALRSPMPVMQGFDSYAEPFHLPVEPLQQMVGLKMTIFLIQHKEELV